MEDWRDELATAGPCVEEDEIAGWIWDRNFSKAVFRTDLFRLDDGVIGYQDDNGQLIHFNGNIYDTERGALCALADLHEARSTRYLVRRDAVMRKIAKLDRREPIHDDGPCPKSDSDCMGGEGDCHDACEHQFKSGGAQ